MNDIEKIYKEYSVSVYKYLLCLTRDKDISEELTQETFYKAILNVHKFKGECKISVWLCQIAKNLYFNTLKKRKKLESINEEDIRLMPDQNSFEDDIIFNEEREWLYKSIQKLDKVTQDIIYFRIQGNMSFKEIGHVFGKTENWARTNFYRGKQKLKEEENYEKL